jgi:hypothetical protein
MTGAHHLFDVREAKLLLLLHLVFSYSFFDDTPVLSTLYF